MGRRRICVVTSGRADYGLLAPIVRALQAEPGLEPRLVATGAHLDPEFGETVRQIEADGLPLAARIPWGPGPAADRAGRVLSGLAAFLTADRPDVVLLVGDRFEILAAAQAAALAGVPVAHLGGGDVSEGAMDDAFRHAITKLSHLHLATHADAALRIRQLGEDPARILVVGNPALDGLVAAAEAVTDAELERRLGAPLGPRNLAVTFHPVTLLPDAGAAEFEALLAALDDLGPGWTLWVSEPNADPGGEGLRTRLHDWARNRPNVHVRAAFGPTFPALVRRCAAVVGNSSAGLAEVPSLGVPTVDVGERQRGRLAGPSVVHAAPTPADVRRALDQALTLDGAASTNPYGDGLSVPRIVAALTALPPAAVLLRKRFHDLEVARG